MQIHIEEHWNQKIVILDIQKAYLTSNNFFDYQEPSSILKTPCWINTCIDMPLTTWIFIKHHTRPTFVWTCLEEVGSLENTILDQHLNIYGLKKLDNILHSVHAFKKLHKVLYKSFIDTIY
jgi:hypothetical protein